MRETSIRRLHGLSHGGEAFGPQTLEVLARSGEDLGQCTGTPTGPIIIVSGMSSPG